MKNLNFIWGMDHMDIHLKILKKYVIIKGE